MDFNLKQEDLCDWQYPAGPYAFMSQRNVIIAICVRKKEIKESRKQKVTPLISTDSLSNLGQLCPCGGAFLFPIDISAVCYQPCCQECLKFSPM